MIKTKKRGGRIKVKDIQKQSNLPFDKFAHSLGISKSSYYNRLNGDQPWTLPELIRLSEYSKDLDIDVDGENYRISIQKTEK